MKIATWNVNSIKARRDRLLAFLERHSPDVVCLQELKAIEDAFPRAEVEALGYHATLVGQKTYNGVAILSREPPAEVSRGMADGAEVEEQARLVGALLSGTWVLSAYFPNGGTPESPKFAYKLEWMKRLRVFLDARFDETAQIALCGDFNVAPDDADVERPEVWANTVLCHPLVREALEHVRAFGFVDTFRKHHPDGHVYSWWDYRMLAFPKNDGLRIDHVFATPALAARSTGALIDRNERKGKQPSDHAPVLVEFADA